MCVCSYVLEVRCEIVVDTMPGTYFKIIQQRGDKEHGDGMKQDRSRVDADSRDGSTVVTVHCAPALKPPVRMAGIISPAEGFQLDPPKPRFSNFTVKKNHWGDVLKCRFPGGTTRNPPSVRLGRGPGICVSNQHSKAGGQSPSLTQTPLGKGATEWL